MKKIFTINAICIIYLLIVHQPMFGQNNRLKTQKQSTTWNGSSWSKGKPNTTTKAIFAGNYKSSEDFSASAVEVLPNVKVIISNNTVLNIVNEFKVAPTGNLTFEETAQLVQKNPNSVNSAADFTRFTAPLQRFDYTYFCSPVSGQQLNLLTDYSSTNYNHSGNPANTYLPPLFDKYYTWDDAAAPVGYDATILDSGAWLNVPETSLMNPAGKGFIVRAPQSFPFNIFQQWKVKFTGEPNDGNITVPMSGASYTPFSGAITTPVTITQTDPSPALPAYQPCANPNYKLNLIGNPYSSAVDADSFLSHPTNVANLGGAIYLWSHKTAISSAFTGDGSTPINYTADDYVMYNLVGGVGSIAGSANRPIGKIAMGQGFFVKGLTNSGAFFNNDMRDGSIATDDQQFFRTNGTNMITLPTKNRFWISLGGKETLVGYMPQTSVPAQVSTAAYTIPGSVNGYDKMYDTELFKTAYNSASELSSRLEFYTLLNTTTPCPRLAIQGRKLDATFNVNDVVPLGFSCPAGTYTIKLENTEGLFTTQLIWLREETNPGVYTYYDDIRTATGHTFTTTTVANDNTTRFQIVFKLPSIPFVTNINPYICGTLLSSIDTTIFTQNVANTTLYSFEVRTDGAFPGGSVLGYYPGNVNPLYPYQFNLNFAPIEPGITYWIRPASYQVNGQWVYGETCQVTTPATPASCIYSPVSGSITSSTWNPIDAHIINNQFGFSATSYRFTATVNGNPFGTTTKTSPRFTLHDLGANATHTNTTFSITVETYWNNAWRPCLTPYFITTANVILRQSENGSPIFEASTYPNPFANNFKLDINTSSEDQIELVVYDMLGRQMETRTIQIADLDTQEIGNNYASGVYNLIIKQADNTKTLRVIKR